MWLINFIIIGTVTTALSDDGTDTDGDTSRKILGSSVVTSVSVVMDSGNGKKTVYTDAVGKPQSKPSNPSDLASPIDLLNPDRYEFYTFDDNGNLVKRLMSMDEIKSIIATGDSDAFDLDSFTSQGFMPEKRVSEIVNNVQNVLKEEMEIFKNPNPNSKPIFDTPDVSDSWSMILPAVFGNSGEDILPEKPIAHVTPDTIMLEPSHSTPAPQILDMIVGSSSTIKNRPTTYSSSKPSSISTHPSTTTYRPVTLNAQSNVITSQFTKPSIKVEVFSNSQSTTPTVIEDKLIVEIKPVEKDKLPSTKTPYTKPTMSTMPFRGSTGSTSTIAFINNKPHTSAIPSSSNRPTTPSFYSTPLVFPTRYAGVLPTATSKITVQPIIPSSTTSNNLNPFISIQKVPTTEAVVHSSSVLPLSITRLPEPTRDPFANKTSHNIPLVRNPSITTVGTTTTTAATSTTQVYNSSVPIWTPSPSDTQLFNIFKDTIAQETITTTAVNDKLTTFGSVEDVKTEATTFKDITTTNVNEMEIPEGTTQHLDDDLSTLSSQYVTNKVAVSNQNEAEDPTTRLPQLQSLSSDQKLSASELLDQLLLTTNIYEINTELAAEKVNLTDDEDLRFDTTESNQPTTLGNDQQSTTTEHDLISYPPTTDMALIQSIEQLLSQAVGNVEQALNNTANSVKVQQMLESSSKKNMTELIKETATLASDITAAEQQTEIEQEPTITTEQNILDAVSTFTSDNLSDSVESLLSQVYDQDASTINRITLTEKPVTGMTFRRTDDKNDVTRPIQPTTQKYIIQASSERDSLSNTSKYDQANTTDNYVQSNETTTTEFLVTEHREDEITTGINEYAINTTEEASDHLINITIISFDANKNRTKPAKADLRLEQENIAEEIKNMSLLLGRPNADNTDPLKETEPNVSANNSTVISSIYPDNDTELINVADQNQAVESITEMVTEQVTAGDLIQNEPEYELISTTPEVETTTDLKHLQSDSTPTGILVNKEPLPQHTTEHLKTTKPLKPSIVIIVNENNTVVTENGHLVANKTISPLSTLIQHSSITKAPNSTSKIEPLSFIPQNSTQDDTWTLVSTVAPHSDKLKDQNVPPPTVPYPESMEPSTPVNLVSKPMQGFGLEESTAKLDTDIYQFTQLCNELAFGFWKTVTNGLSSARSVFVSPFAATSMLAMVFLGARGATSGEMNEILRLDDMVTFNPHLTLKNVTESINSEPDSGIAASAMIRELFSDRSKGKLLDFYKNRVRAFYDGYVEEVSYREIGDVIRRRTNMLVKKYTDGKYPEFLKDSSITVRPPLAGVSVNIFQTDCTHASFDGRDGELHFVVLPSIRQRRLIPIPAVVYRSGFLAGYEPSLDATAVALGTKDQIVSTILVVPGQQGIAALGDGLTRLEKRLVESSFKKGAWSRLLRSLIPRPGLEVQIPRFSHRSVINSTVTLKKMGLHELFSPEKADLRGLNGVANELHLSDVLQINCFATCGENRIGETHHSEVYPATALRARAARYLEDIPSVDLEEEPRDYQRAFHDPLHNPSFFALPLSLRPRQARLPEIPRLRFDRPFLYFVRHNPTGLILHMGRFNPRLLP